MKSYSELMELEPKDRVQVIDEKWGFKIWNGGQTGSSVVLGHKLEGPIHLQHRQAKLLRDYLIAMFPVDDE